MQLDSLVKDVKQILMNVKESFVTMVAHAKMELTLSPVTVWRESLVKDVKQILMIVLESFVKMGEHVKMESTLSPVTVQRDSLEPTVKQILKIVSLEPSVRFLLFHTLHK